MFEVALRTAAELLIVHWVLDSAMPYLLQTIGRCLRGLGRRPDDRANSRRVLAPNSIRDHQHRSVFQTTHQLPPPPRISRKQTARVSRLEPHWSIQDCYRKSERGCSKKDASASALRKFLASVHLHVRIPIISICLAILPTPHYIAVLARGVRARMSQSRPLVADLPDYPLH